MNVWRIDNDTVNLLLEWCKNSNYCPTANGVSVHELSLYILSVRNKLVHVLFHLSHCHLCRPQISRRFRKKLAVLEREHIVNAMLIQHEELVLRDLLKIAGMKAVFFKQFSVQNDRKLLIEFHSDLDILIMKQNLQTFVQLYKYRGYSVYSTVVKKEIKLINPKSHIKIDIHFLIAFPHYGDLTPLELQTVQRFGDDLFRFSSASSDVIVRPAVEYQYISMIMRFLWNDMVLCLRTLHDITQVYNLHQKSINWRVFFAITDKYGITSEVLFVLCLSGKIFYNPLPHQVSEKLTWFVTALAENISVRDIVLFPSVNNWYSGTNAQFVHQYYQRYTLLKLCLHHNTPFIRLIRPRILLFLAMVCYRWLTRKKAVRI